MEFNGTFLATIITFIVFVLLMNKVLYAPILNIMEQRKSFIDGNYGEAKKNEAKIQKLEQKKEEKLLEAKNDAKDLFNETLAEFKEQEEKIVEEAKSIAEENIENSRIDLENVSNEVEESLKCSMTDLANDIVEKVIGYRSEINGFDGKIVDEILYQ
jgi:F-type H+-transporting ATPase subunit b